MELPLTYTFSGKQWLSSSPPSCVNRKVYLCMYDVHKEGKFPFQRYLLSSLNGRLLFPHIWSSNNDPLEEIAAHIQTIIKDKNNEKDIQYEGFYEYENELYCFIDITLCGLYMQLDEYFSSSRQWFVLMDEILNQNKVCNIAIEPRVTDFFLYNEDFCFLLDAEQKQYELPIVGYVTKPVAKMNFTQVFGQTKSMDIYGSYYYFTDYWSCFEKDIKKELKDPLEKEGIVRFALFLGNTRYVENLESDPLDNSFVKKKKLMEEIKAGATDGFEHKTMRITDYDGKWAETYDSLFLGNLILNNAELLKNWMIVIKDYSQQIPLSIHLIKCLEDYSII
jgi:hypothetical protein